MKKFVYSFAGLVLAASAAHAQPAEEPTGAIAEPGAHAGHAEPAPSTDTTAGPAAPAEPAAPAGPAAPAAAAAPIAAATVTEAEVDSFAKATVKLQAIQADATIAADLKQAVMQAAVTEAGLDPAKYNAIGKAVQVDPELRARVQTAMARHTTPPPGDG
jgi:hypothetical protein